MNINNFNFYFKLVSKKFSSKVALIDVNDKKFTYKKLDILSDNVSNFFNEKLTKENIIAIDSQKNYLTILAFLGTLKSGITYFFIDLSQPKKRITNILKKTNTNYLISEKKIKFKNIVTLSISEILQSKKKFFSSERLFPDNHPAYVMFTSGSTGDPKGAIISHLNVINFVKWSRKNFLIKNKDILSQVNPLFFDNSVFDLYNSFLNGCTLVLTDGLDINEPQKLLKRLKKYRCSIWFSTPSLLIYFINIGLIDKKNFFYFKKIIFGGEGFPKDKLYDLVKKLGNQKLYFNVYGPTECTCICSSYLIKKTVFFDKKNIYAPLGKIAKFFKYKIVNDKNKKALDNEIGELVLSGPNVGYGYINDKANTKKNFILKKKERIYKTGDLVKYDKKEDLIYFVGRKDSQIKHMGYRIELNELEIVINKMKLVKEVCVFYLKKSSKDFGKIIAVISSDKVIKYVNVIEHIKKFLPNYFLPNELFFCQNLKKNKNGKIDRPYLKKFYERKIDY